MRRSRLCQRKRRDKATLQGGSKTLPLQTAGGVQEARVLTKSDVLPLISSNLPEAERFEAWVFEEVLPAVLKTGQYIAPQVLKDLIEGAAERAVEDYKTLDRVNFNMLKQDVTIMDILACKAGHGPDGIKRLTVQLLRKYGRPDLIGMLEMLGEVSDYDQHQSWAAVEELAQSYLKDLVAARKQAGKKPLPEPTPEEFEAAFLNWRMKYMPYSLVTNPVFVTHLTSGGKCARIRRKSLRKEPHQHVVEPRNRPNDCNMERFSEPEPVVTGKLT